jgi:membrane fusion protein, multidrug efflux system
LDSIRRACRRAAAAIGGVAMVSCVAGCHQAAPAARALPPVPVTVAVASRRDMPTRLQAIGAVQTVNTVAVKALVNGELKDVGLHQGDAVHRGQVLFEIDPQPFQAALAQAQATLARDTATARLDEIEAKRYADLANRGLVSTEQRDQQQTLADAAGATVKADEAVINAAKLNLSYCTIVSPIDGRAGRLLVQPGNLVAANSTVLVTINQISPIYAAFSVPEQYLEALRAADRAHTLTVEAQGKGETGTETGELSFINNAIDSSTGTIQLMARFANQDERLWPGQFVNVELTLAVEVGATVVPATAVETGPNDLYVYVLTPDKHVERRAVVAGTTADGLTVITRGVEPGETVVTDGQLELSPGAAVTVAPPAAAAPAAPSLR